MTDLEAVERLVWRIFGNEPGKFSVQYSDARKPMGHRLATLVGPMLARFDAGVGPTDEAALRDLRQRLHAILARWVAKKDNDLRKLRFERARLAARQRSDVEIRREFSAELRATALPEND